ncbi:MAG TPA: hypothetical protein VLQ78_07135, partial [Ornithinibacter sp.]|nr:hypothetical protein [Ornithinibacter sp.]
MTRATASPPARPSTELTARLQRAMAQAFGPGYADADPLLRPSRYADLQANVALPLAKRLGSSPREVATRLVDALDVEGLCAPPQISGPGFINLTLEPSWIAATTTAMAGDPRLGVVT